MSGTIAGILSDLDRILLDAPTIQNRVIDMAREIQQDSTGEIDVVCLMDGALFFMADLLRNMDIPVRLHTLNVSSYHGGTSSSGVLRMAEHLPFQLTGRQVLVVDDILDSGLTLATVQQRLREQCHPASLRTAVLLHKRREQAREVMVDYIGFEIEDEFVVGYGMDYQGHYRHLPCIGILNPRNLPQA